ncbi:hypothetical protein A6S26_06170 [Nostoc sp. ATCC 43529]|nr:hypothetical protein A6S26_06170 [Nostoc sp. ATCC 43529]
MKMRQSTSLTAFNNLSTKIKKGRHSTSSYGDSEIKVKSKRNTEFIFLLLFNFLLLPYGV